MAKNMLKIMILKIMVIIAVIAVPVVATATGTTAADFLNISVSAYQASVGGSCTALSNGVASSYFNPAGLSFVEQPGINLMHNMWYQDISYEYIGAALPVSDNSTFGFSASYLHMGEIDAYNIYDQNMGAISPYSLAGIVSYGRHIWRGLSFGVSGKYIMEKLDDIEANGYAFDFGTQYQYDLFTFGLVVSNIGPSMKYELESFKLPASVSLGTAFSPSRLPVTLIIGGKVPFEGKPSLSTGIDYRLTDFLSLRSGAQGLGTENTSNIANFGIGLKLMGSSIDYAFNPKGEFGNTHFFSFTLSFGKVRNVEFSKNKNSDIIYETADNVNSDETDPIYIVDAGVFKNETSALKRAEILKQFGLDSNTETDNNGGYLVVLIKTENRKQAEKVQKEARAKGFECNLNFR